MNLLEYNAFIIRGRVNSNKVIIDEFWRHFGLCRHLLLSQICEC